MQGNMAKALKNRASKQEYVSPSQLAISGFDTPFTQYLNPDNRWVVLAGKIPWDKLVSVYENQMHNCSPIVLFIKYIFNSSSCVRFSNASREG